MPHVPPQARIIRQAEIGEPCFGAGLACIRVLRNDGIAGHAACQKAVVAEAVVAPVRTRSEAPIQKRRSSWDRHRQDRRTLGPKRIDFLAETGHGDKRTQPRRGDMTRGRNLPRPRFQTGKAPSGIQILTAPLDLNEMIRSRTPVGGRKA